MCNQENSPDLLRFYAVTLLLSYSLPSHYSVCSPLLLNVNYSQTELTSRTRPSREKLYGGSECRYEGVAVKRTKMANKKLSFVLNSTLDQE